MKRAIFLAAALGVAPFAFGQSASADVPNQLFNILTPAAGNVQFSGQGTATFNQSLGTNNNFNVGSSTNIGVNASASSTQDYVASGSGNLDLSGSSRLQQTIGTASEAFNTSVVTEAAATAAHSIATESANTSTWGISAEAKYGAEYTNGDAAVKADYEAQWSAGWEAEFKQAYTNAYSNVVSNSSVTSQTAESGAEQSGVISANFMTTEIGGGTQAIQSAMAHQLASAEYGTEWVAGTKYDGEEYANQSEWQAAYDVAYNQGYAASAVNASAATSRISESDVKVTGIGVISDVVAAATSSFTAEATKNTAHEEGNGNANASSGVQMSTASFATQANSTSANAFMQAFGSN
ncbi:hypothetical protein [Synechococcus sp. 8F6]|uniref:hypothetical protein n=1 Tax=Synechococcus sp. 8F6 TaxID=2025606 RepID=UPI001303D0BF|nr:hypothetical protein [Synechococcus sp. 8F6]